MGTKERYEGYKPTVRGGTYPKRVGGAKSYPLQYEGMISFRLKEESRRRNRRREDIGEREEYL